MDVRSFRAMGSPCRIVVDGGRRPDLADRAVELVGRLERLWSRFLTDSEVSHLNRRAGDLRIVSAETYLLVERAVAAQALTEGRFHPLMLDQLRTLGYDTSWQDCDWTVSHAASRVQRRPATDEPIMLLPDVCGVSIPEGCSFDPGGIGKGLAADLVTEFLVDHGITTSSVELGGDLRVTGQSWHDADWRVGVADPFDNSADIATFAPAHGAVATSSVLRRRWMVDGEPRHHLIDPGTGRPAETDVVAATACSTEAWWADVAAKVALMAGGDEAIDLLERLDTPGLIVTADGTLRTTNGRDAREQGMVTA